MKKITVLWSTLTVLQESGETSKCWRPKKDEKPGGGHVYSVPVNLDGLARERLSFSVFHERFPLIAKLYFKVPVVSHALCLFILRVYSIEN